MSIRGLRPESRLLVLISEFSQTVSTTSGQNMHQENMPSACDISTSTNRSWSAYNFEKPYERRDLHELPALFANLAAAWCACAAKKEKTRRAAEVFTASAPLRQTHP
jgi:hypothetical protein